MAVPPLCCQSKFPCLVCDKAVAWEAKGLQCDGCDKWAHIGCIRVGDSTYNAVGNSSNLWLCPDCGIPNSTALIDTYNITVSNSFSILNQDVSLDEYTDLDSTVRSDTVLLEPQNFSTPCKPVNKTKFSKTAIKFG